MYGGCKSVNSKTEEEQEEEKSCYIGNALFLKLSGEYIYVCYIVFPFCIFYVFYTNSMSRQYL